MQFIYEQKPDGFFPLSLEPKFCPSVHLALERPTEVISLTDFGYKQDQIADCPSDFVQSPISFAFSVMKAWHVCMKWLSN